ncbi:MAG: (deoxy)nucleoside triphosphate pyrophosphohydrolase [Hydrotalea sp.]|nr:(deoxy)nucleoside triphosphate pyrophosphohydrolase [Hydrotalea sp.]
MSCFETTDKPIKPKPLKLVVAGVLVDADGRVLVGQRAAGKSFAGHWEFPGGKIEKNETPEVALIRELREELAIDTNRSCLAPILFASHDYDDFHLLMPVFVLRQWRGNIAPRAETFSTTKWLRLPGLAALDGLLPADKPIVSMLHQFI